MKGWVLDSSLALAWALPDEGSMRAERFLARETGERVLWVPALWWYEVANALTLAERRRRLAEDDRIRVIALYGLLPLQTDVELDTKRLGRLHALARAHALSAYDAAYLELAERKGLGLATLDRRLLTAARTAGVRAL